MATLQEKDTYFYIGTYGSSEEQGIYLAAMDRETGELQLINGKSGIENASFLAWNELNRVLYAVSEKENSEAAAFYADPETQQLKECSRQATESSGACYVSRSGDGKYLFTAGYSDAGITVFSLEEDGEIKEICSRIQHSGSSVREDRQSEAHAHMIIQDPNGEYVLVSDLGMDEIVMYRLEDGKLVTHREVKLPPGSGPRHLAFHPSKQWLYCINELNSTVSVFAYDATFGDLKPLQNISTLPEDVEMEGNSPAEVLVSPCGRFLYGSNRGHDSIVQYEIDEETGMLRAVNWVSSGGKNPRSFSILPGGFLVTANQDNNLIASLKMNEENGRLESTGHTLEVPRPVCVCPVEKA